ncbi:MAG: CBS domain-containing protein [Chloroflexota bacterium]
MNYRVTPEEKELVERFQTAFNRIERAMQGLLRLPHETFGILLQQMYENSKILPNERVFLDDCRVLRNRLIHDNFQIDHYQLIPSHSIVERIEFIADNFEDTPTVYKYFAKKVQSVNANDTLYRVMKLIQDTSFTQFPVYDDDKKFVNLLTENVITRWLSKHTVIIQEMAFADLRHTVEQALTLQDGNDHWEFIPRTMTISAATAIFAAQPTIEALLITETGEVHETPIGIVTRSDALDLLDGEQHLT